MMITSSWRRSRTRDTNAIYKANFKEENMGMELHIPNHFRCPISLDLMKDPVTLSTGITYDREGIEKWIEEGNFTCPVTNQEMLSFDQIPNHAIRRMIQVWCVENHCNGVERIVTPRIPVTSTEVSNICSKIMTTSRRRDVKRCTELVKKMKRLIRESERNKKCFVENGASSVLSACFESFSSVSIEENESLLGEILFILQMMFPLGMEGKSRLCSPSSLNGMSFFLKGKDLSFKQNVVVILREIFSLDQKHVESFAKIEGVDEALVRIIKQQVCPKTTKATVMVIYRMISPSSTQEKMIKRFVELGLIPLLLEMIISDERSLCEKALSILDIICSCKIGLEKARDNALTLPACVKKLLRVSTTATELSVLILWKLLKSEDGYNDQLVKDALHLSSFQKLLVVLQVGCGEKAKEKTTELLKVFNQQRVSLGCTDSLTGFRNLKRT